MAHKSPPDGLLAAATGRGQFNNAPQRVRGWAATRLLFAEKNEYRYKTSGRKLPAGRGRPLSPSPRNIFPPITFPPRLWDITNPRPSSATKNVPLRHTRPRVTYWETLSSHTHARADHHRVIISDPRGRRSRFSMVYNLSFAQSPHAAAAAAA